MSKNRKRNTWASSVSDQVLLSTPIHEQSRQEAVYALIHNERHYRNELDTLYTRLVQPLYEFDRVDPQERATFIQSVFQNLKDLKQANQKLVHALSDRQKEFESLIPTVSDVFSAHFLPILDDYQVYCSNLPRATYLLTTHPTFPPHLTQQEWPLLKTPLQHLERYPTLLKRVIVTTTDDHPDHEVLSLCLDAIQLCLENLNQQLETKKELLEIEKWVGNAWRLDAPERRIMYRCKAQSVVVSSTATSSSSSSSQQQQQQQQLGDIIVLDHVVLVLLPPVLFIPLPIVVYIVPSHHHDTTTPAIVTLAHPPRGITYRVQLDAPQKLVEAIADAQKELKQKQPHLLSDPPLVSSTIESWTAAVRLPDGRLAVGSHHGVTLYPSRERIIEIDCSKLAILAKNHHDHDSGPFLVVASHRRQLLLIYKLNETNNRMMRDQQPWMIENVLDGFHVIDQYIVYQDRADMLVHLWNPRKRRSVKTMDVQSVRVSGFSSFIEQERHWLVMACDADFVLVDISGQAMRRRISLKDSGGVNGGSKALSLAVNGERLCYNRALWCICCMKKDAN
ncbi:Dbl homology domain-containing protein [Zychaea mexicana]|uniref:rho guanine nucleotide exchange factor n=1 Tax=Zychaea mexicana TaxID=64656 RepID=UPI0022FE4C59|nr:rho guanine nucleotide exchange factor [Zychaea mexicana]KAI9488795.1 Dbl homology domain-containing protein [Zychaea mexicana]